MNVFFFPTSRRYESISRLMAVMALTGLVTMNSAFGQTAVEATGTSTPTSTAGPLTAPDPDLPQTFNPAIAETMVTASPFTRALNLSDSLVLTGIAFIEGKSVATILNKEKNESYVVSDKPNAQGWRLAETNAAVQLNKTQAKIMVNNELVTVRYATEQITPENKRQTRPGGSDSGRGDRGRSGESDRGSFYKSESYQRLMQLSEESRSKLRDEMSNSREKLQNMSSEERTQYFDKVLKKYEKGKK